MRKVILYLIIGVLLILAAYFLSRELSPLNLEKLEELILAEEIQAGDVEKLNEEINELISRGLIMSYLSENAYVIVLCALGGIFFLFISIHLVIDKIFFKNFYENPSTFDAVRRGLFFVGAIALLLFSKLNNAEPYVMGLIIVVPILIEVVIKLYFKKPPEEKKVEEEVVEKEHEGKHISFEDAMDNLEGVAPVEEKEAL